MAKANGAGHFNIGGAKGKGTGSAPSTPRKARPQAAHVSTPTSASKRKHASVKVEDGVTANASINVDGDDDDEEDDVKNMAALKVSPQETAWLHDHTGASADAYADAVADGHVDAYPTPSGDIDANGLECGESPRKRSRREGVKVKMETYAVDDGEGDEYEYGGGESSGSEFADAV